MNAPFAHMEAIKAYLARPITDWALDRLKGRLWDKVAVKAGDECWNWTGKINASGYGIIVDRKREWLAHRIALAMVGRRPPPDRMVCHHCDNRACCNPAHLYLGDAKLNARDRDQRDRGNWRSGEQHGRAKLSWPDVKEIRASNDGYGALAKRYGVAKATIRNAKLGRTWGGAE